MTSAELRRFLWVALLAAACGGSGSSRSLASSGPNVVPISVDGAGCLPSAYFNEPCVSAKVCVPGTSTCQTIGGLLLDTGSSGLRVFSQALPPALAQALPAVRSGGNPVAECIGFLDGSSQWGPVVTADVVLGGEPAVNVPIHVIQSTYPGAPSACTGAQTDPASAGYNGILGVQQWMQDCGPGCVPPKTTNGWYFACSGSTCTGTAVDLGSQVTNPVAKLPVDGNGVVVVLPSLPITGAASVAGYLVLGIGTRDNNVPAASVAAFPLDGFGNFRTDMSGTGAVSSFVDTGSNGIFFPTSNPALATCAPPEDSWFCPATPVTLTATNSGSAGSPSRPLTFQIARIDTLPGSVGVAPAVGGPSSPDFDWGLPFHFGRAVYVGVEGTDSPLGTGPLVGY